MTEVIRTFHGKILGEIRSDSKGNKTAYDYYGTKLGSYNVSDNTTRDFYGVILAYGDVTSALVYNKR